MDIWYGLESGKHYIKPQEKSASRACRQEGGKLNATRFRLVETFDSHCAPRCLSPSVCPAVDLAPGVRPAAIFPSATVISPCGSVEAITNEAPSQFDSNFHAASRIPMFTPWILHRLYSLDPCSIDFLRRSSYIAYKISRLTSLNYQCVSPEFSIFRHGKARLRLPPRAMPRYLSIEVNTVLPRHR